MQYVGIIGSENYVHSSYNHLAENNVHVLLCQMQQLKHETNMLVLHSKPRMHTKSLILYLNRRQKHIYLFIYLSLSLYIYIYIIQAGIVT